MKAVISTTDQELFH